jgi:hypothetical protein
MTGEDMVPILEDSIEAAKQRHPSSLPVEAPIPDVLTAADRCDGCSASALYRLTTVKDSVALVLDLCHHHGKKFAEAMSQSWSIVGHNASLMRELYATDRLKGSDH